MPLGDGAEFVGGDDGLQVGGETLFVDRDGGGLHFLGGGDDERGEFHPVRYGVALSGGRERDVVESGLPGGDGDGSGDGRHAGVEQFHPRRADGDALDAVGARGIGEGFERGAFDGDADTFQKTIGASGQDPAGDRSGGVGGGLRGADGADRGDGGEGEKERKREGAKRAR